jgi:hypothetical protein
VLGKYCTVAEIPFHILGRFLRGKGSHSIVWQSFRFQNMNVLSNSFSSSHGGHTFKDGNETFRI